MFPKIEEPPQKDDVNQFPHRLVAAVQNLVPRQPGAYTRDVCASGIVRVNCVQEVSEYVEL